MAFAFFSGPSGGVADDATILLMMDVYRQARHFQMRRLEQLCMHYLEACITHANVLVALQNAERLKVLFLKVSELPRSPRTNAISYQFFFIIY